MSSFRIEQIGNAHVVEVEGTLGFAEANALQDALQEPLDSGATRFIVDLTKADLVASDGLRVLIQLRQNVTSKGGYVRIVCNNRLILSVFTMTRLDQIFQIVPSRDEALDSA